jgi:hypothetical protein
VQLAFLDEAGTDGRSSCVIYGAVVVPPGAFGYLESLHNTAIQQILGVDEIREKFTEFHASALYLGKAPFDGIDEKKRFAAIQVLLTCSLYGIEINPGLPLEDERIRFLGLAFRIRVQRPTCTREKRNQTQGLKNDVPNSLRFFRHSKPPLEAFLLIFLSVFLSCHWSKAEFLYHVRRTFAGD